MIFRGSRGLTRWGSLFVFLAAAGIFAQTPPKKAGKKVQTKPMPPSAKKPKETAAVVARMLDFLARQQHGDGGWCPDRGFLCVRVAATALCGLALQASGAYASSVRKATGFVAKNLFTMQEGIQKGGDHSNWQVGIGTTFLAEYYAATRDGTVQPILQKAAADIFRRMEDTGGWAHGPNQKGIAAYDEFMGVTGWMLAAAASLRRQGFALPRAEFDRGIAYIGKCNRGGHIGYSHRPGQKGIKASARTGMALFIYALLDRREDPLFAEMSSAFEARMSDAAESHASIALGLLTCALGARQLGPQVWDRYVEMYFPKILLQVRPDGSAQALTSPRGDSDDGSHGPHFPTGIYALILQLDLGHLPILGLAKSR